jgi:hypothetical protein
MEQIGGVMALAHMCKAGHLAEVAFALLEADPMILDVAIMMLTCTPYIGGEGDYDSASYRDAMNAFEDANPETDLSPDQDSPEYIELLKKGPIMLLHSLLYQEFYQAFRAALTRSSMFPLLVKRLLRVISRESQGTKDGVALAFYLKGVLDIACNLDLDPAANKKFFTRPLPEELGTGLLEQLDGLTTLDEIKPVLQQAFGSSS